MKAICATYIIARFRAPKMLEVVDFAVGKILRILQNDDVFALEFGTGNEVLVDKAAEISNVSNRRALKTRRKFSYRPVLWLDVEFFDGLVAEDIARSCDSSDLRVVGENLVGDGAEVLSLRVFAEVQLNQLLQSKRLSRHRVLNTV